MALKFNVGNIFKLFSEKKIQTDLGPKLVKDIYTPELFKQVMFDNIKHSPQQQKYVTSINDSLVDNTLSNKVLPNITGLAVGNKKSIEKTFLGVDSEIKARRFTKALSVEGLDDKQTFRNTKAFVKQGLRHYEHSFRQGFRRYEQNILNKLNEKSGLQGVQGFKLLLRAPKKFETLFGLTQDDILAAAYDGSKFDNPVIDGMVQSISEAEQDLFKELQDLGVVIGDNSKELAPFQLDPDIVNIIGEIPLRDIVVKYTNLGVDEAADFVESLKVRRFNFDNLVAVFKDFNLQFNSGKDMIGFYKEVNQDDFALNIFNEFFMQKQRNIRLALLQSIYGNDPLQTMSKAVMNSRIGLGRNRQPTLDKAYSTLLNDFKLRLNLISGKRFVDNETWYRLSNIANQAMSFITASPSRSAVRNLVLDNEGHDLSLGHTIYNADTNIGKSVKNIFTNLSFLLRQAIGNPQQKAAIANILDISGWANSVDGLFQGNVMSFEDIFDIGSDKTASALGYVENKLRQGQDNLYRWSGNHSLIDINRARRAVSIQQLMTNVFEHSNYRAWIESLDDTALKQLDYLKTNFELTEDVFNFLKVANKTEVNFKHEALSGLGFDKFPAFISKQSILDTPDEVAMKFKRPDEGVDTFKKRVANGWQSFIYNSTTRKTPIPTVADSITGPLLTNTPAWIGFTIRPFIKYVDSAQAQMVNWLEEMATAVYGRPTQWIGFDKSLLAWTKGLAVYTAYGAAVIWIKDLLNNRQPTDFTDPKNLEKLIAITGFGGYANMFAANVRGIFPARTGSAYSTTPLSIVTDALAHKKYKKEFDLDEALTKIATKNPYSRLWYASGLTDYIFNRLLLEQHEVNKKVRNMESYGKPYLFN